MLSLASRLAFNCVCLPVPWFPGPVHKSEFTVGVVQAGRRGWENRYQKTWVPILALALTELWAGALSRSPSSLCVKWAYAWRCGKIPQTWQTFLVSLCILIRIAFSPLGWERRRLCYNPFQVVEYTDNGKINRGVLLFWPVNKKTVFRAKSCVGLERPRIFLPCRMASDPTVHLLGNHMIWVWGELFLGRALPQRRVCWLLSFCWTTVTNVGLLEVGPWSGLTWRTLFFPMDRRQPAGAAYLSCSPASRTLTLALAPPHQLTLESTSF